MGSYAKVTGNFTLDKVVTKQVLSEIEKECEIYDGFMFNGSESLKNVKEKKTFKDRYIKFSAEWKGFLGDEALETVKQLYTAFSKRGIKIIEGVMFVNHEYGDKWKVVITDKVISLLEGAVTYTPLKKVDIKVTEQVTESVSFV